MLKKKCSGRNQLWLIYCALLSGALMSVQGVFNTQVTKTTGMWVSNAWVQLTAFLLCVVAWFFAGIGQCQHYLRKS